MSLISESKEHLVGVINDLFQHLEQVDNATEVTLHQRTQEVEKLKNENEKLRGELEDASTRRWREEHEELEKKYDKVLRESERLKQVNKDLYARLSQAQSKLRDWNRLSSPYPRSSPNVPPDALNIVGKSGNESSKHVPERHSTPDLPPVPSGGLENADARPSGLTNAVRRNSAEHTELHRKPQAPRVLDLAGSDSSDLSTQDVRAIVNSGQKRKRGETQSPELPTNAPTRETGHASNPVTVKSEPSSSNVDGQEKAGDMPSSSNPEDLSRSLRPPTPKRPKGHNDQVNPAARRAGLRLLWDNGNHSSTFDRPERSNPSEGSAPSGTTSTPTELLRLWHNTATAPSTPRSPAASRASPRPQSSRKPLQQLDHNAKVLPRTSGLAGTSSRKRRSGAEAVHHLAEDGEEMLLAPNAPELKSSKASIAPVLNREGDHVAAHRRLDQLLSTPSPGRPALPQQANKDRALASSSFSGSDGSVTKIPGLTTETVAGSKERSHREAMTDALTAIKNAFEIMNPREDKALRHALGAAEYASAGWFDILEVELKKYGIPMPERPTAYPKPRWRNAEQSNTNPSRTQTPPNQPQQSTASIPPPNERANAPTPHSHPQTSPDPDDEPLRARPLHRLTLEDFKINPSRNDGLIYAYSDVVRNRAARKCLPGCTRPECCGTKFRALAADLPASDDDDLLRGYLGPSLSTPSQIAHLTDTERSDLILQAKTKMVADKYGKQHRHQWQPQRPKSPPGFWRTDFPATQEVEEDRKEAEKVVRDMVEGRWREAMMDNGRWKFKHD